MVVFFFFFFCGGRASAAHSLREKKQGRINLSRKLADDNLSAAEEGCIHRRGIYLLGYIYKLFYCRGYYTDTHTHDTHSAESSREKQQMTVDLLFIRRFI